MSDHIQPSAGSPSDGAGTREQEQFRRALETSREVGAAVGILMERLGLTYDAAWCELRCASQRRNRPVREIAAELVLTGVFDASCGAGNSAGEHPVSK